MPKIRKCAQCQQPSLTPVSRRMQIYNSVIHHKCDNCAAEVDITPLASIGTATMVGILALGFWGVILFHGSGSPDMLSIGIFGAAAVAYLGLVILPPMVVQLKHPVVKDDHQTRVIPVRDEKHLLRKPVIWIEKFGFLAGLLAPVAIGLGVLGIAAIIGYINFTYF